MQLVLFRVFDRYSNPFTVLALVQYADLYCIHT